MSLFNVNDFYEIANTYFLYHDMLKNYNTEITRHRIVSGRDTRGAPDGEPADGGELKSDGTVLL